MATRTSGSPTLTGALAAALLVTGCATALLPRQPDVDLLYSRAARSHGPERNPVIVIPGLTGSNLLDPATGRVVWGTLGGDSAAPDEPADARLIALPMREGVPLHELTDNVRSNGVLDRLRVKILGIPINLDAYYYILEALGVGGYREESRAIATGIDWGDEHNTCFQFDYDWRRDNVENAQRLQRFIEEKRAYVQNELERKFGSRRPDLRFDVVSHSMGGLLLRYYLRFGAADLPHDGSLPEVTWAGAADIERAILVATPNAGTIESLVNLVEGKGYGPFPDYSPTLLGTFPSGYQMLPRGRHAMILEDGQPVPDLFDPALWRRMKWGLAAPEAEDDLEWLLPDEEPAARRRIALDHQAKVLERARQFTAALDQQAKTPENLEIYLVAGDAIPTPRTAAYNSQTGKLEILSFEPGDGKVLRSSALLDERMNGSNAPFLRSPIDWRSVMFLPAGHLELTKGPVFTNNILYWLLEDPR
jgi:hypothetical protein